MSVSAIMGFAAEMIEFIVELAAGTVTIEKARKRAAELLARKPEMFTDALLAEIDAKIAELEKPAEASESRL